MTIESTAKNRARRIAKAERARNTDYIKRDVRRAKRALGALNRFERRWPALIKAADDSAHAVHSLQLTRQRVHAAYAQHKHRLPIAS